MRASATYQGNGPIRPKLRYGPAGKPNATALASRHVRKPRLCLNAVHEAVLSTLFLTVECLQDLKTAKAIVEERNANGPFVDQDDFNKRLPHITHGELCNFFDVDYSCPVTATDHPPPAPVPLCPETTELSLVCEAIKSVALAQGTSSRLSNQAVTTFRTECHEDETLVTIAAWNCARLSPRSANFAKKCSVLEIMVADTPGLAIILLQEVVASSMPEIVHRLQTSTGDSGWTARGCGAAGDSSVTVQHQHEHKHSYGATCQTALYNASKVRCLASAYVQTTDPDKPSFKRPPHVCLFETIRGTNSPCKLLCTSNCHMSPRIAGQEVELLTDLVQAMRVACIRAVRRPGRAGLRRVGEVTYLVAGDFNKSACAREFCRLRREEEFVELVQSPREEGISQRARLSSERWPTEEWNDSGLANEPSAPLRYLTDPTTRGGLHIDNVWMHRITRMQDLVDAWQYIPGGSGRSLRESGHASAGRLRSERSDHVPIILKLRLCAVSDDDGGQSQNTDGNGDRSERLARPRNDCSDQFDNPHALWAVVDDFHVTLHS